MANRIPTPLELSRIKSDQERQQQQAMLEHRQAAALAMQGHRVRIFSILQLLKLEIYLDYINHVAATTNDNTTPTTTRCSNRTSNNSSCWSTAASSTSASNSSLNVTTT